MTTDSLLCLPLLQCTPLAEGCSVRGFEVSSKELPADFAQLSRQDTDFHLLDCLPTCENLCQNKMPAHKKPKLTRSFKIEARDFLRAGEVSLQVQKTLKNIGFEEELVRRVAICAYEAEMNVVLHGGDGVLTLTLRFGEIVLDVKDGGPGIENIELALKEGYSTATPEQREMGFGAGMGLPNIQKNADSFEIKSWKGTGTHLRIGLKAIKEGGEING